MAKDKFLNHFLVDRYILLEFLLPFLFSLGLFLSITLFGFVIFNLIDMMVKFGVPFYLILKLFVYNIPEMLYYSIPMSVLLASLLSTVRLNKDNELTIFQNSGRSPYRLFLPVFSFVIFLCFLSLWFNYSVVSKSNFEVSKNNFLAQTKRNMPIYKENIFYKDFQNYQLKRSFYARQFINGVMLNPIVEEFENNLITKIIQAEKAELNMDKWTFNRGNVYILEKGEITSSLKFEEYSFPFLYSLKNIAQEIRSPKEMNYSELRNYIDDLKKSGEKTSSLEVQLHQKISISFVSLFFFLVAVPLGLTKKSSTFAYTFSLFFIFGYYIVLFISTTLGNLEIINPIFSAWLPNLLVLITLFFWKLKKS